MVARLIHHRSAQREMPLIKVNCAAIPDTLLESELFGHVRGAFTGATATKRGKFARRRRLDLPRRDRHAQPGGAVESCCACCRSGIEPLGAERTQSVDVRVIAATNRDLKQLVSEAKVPGGSLLPPERDSDRAAAAARMTTSGC